MERFTGQVAIVTGAARGIGYAVAERLSGEGAAVAVIDINGAGAKAAAEKLGAAGGTAAAWTADVTDEAQVRDGFAAALDTFGKVDVLINNAGIYPHIPFETMDYAQWKRILSVNLDSTFLCSHAVFPAMKAAGYGRIVNFSSGTVFKGFAGVTAYAASKAGIIGFTRVLASEGGPHGITVNAIAPGLTASEGVMETIPHIIEATVATQPVRRVGEVGDMAECVAYLASPAAGFITGQTVLVDGGARFN
jgi:NAD(P)-dependent dehydrogenase (short-subunit alcohol dehydrogenase family)